MLSMQKLNRKATNASPALTYLEGRRRRILAFFESKSDQNGYYLDWESAKTWSELLLHA